MFEIALYGGAFNPPHAGHAQVMIEASRQARRVLVVPSLRHPYGKQMVDYEVRLNWLESIVENVQPLCCAEVRASRVEQVVARGVEGAIYSYTLLAHLADSLALDGKRIALVVGQDVADRLPTFYRGQELLERFFPFFAWRKGSTCAARWFATDWLWANRFPATGWHRA
nr:hypothetical protein GCM10020185_33370 [Pseudomonas brassicacearum subsp. brassicacearum]